MKFYYYLILITSLISSGNINSKHFDQALLNAAKNNDISEIESIIDNNSSDVLDMQYQDENGKTAVMWSCINNNYPALELLTQCKFNINTKDNNGRTPLMIAAGKGELVLVECLESQGADLNAQDELGNTALIYATLASHLDVVYFLAKNNNCNLDTQNYEGNTATIIAGSHKSSKILEVLLNFHSNPFIKNKKEQSVLTKALEVKNKKSIALIYFRMAVNYDSGTHTEVNYEIARNLFEYIIKQFNLPDLTIYCYNRLGTIYYLGNGVEIDYPQALEYFERILNSTSTYGLSEDEQYLINYYVAYIYCKNNNYKTALPFLEAICEANNEYYKAFAYVQLGAIYLYGLETEKNLELSLKYYKLAASQNVNLAEQAHANIHLGKFYSQVKSYKDINLAIDCFNKAVNQDASAELKEIALQHLELLKNNNHQEEQKS